MIASLAALLSSGWAKVAGWAAAAAAPVAAFGAVWLAARREGAATQQARTMQEGEQARAKADQVAADVSRMGDGDVERELRARFTRPQ